METAIVMVALIGFVAFRHYLSHHRRIMIHRERMVAIEKGVDLPVEQEVRRSNINVQRILLLAGLVWISLGIATYSVLAVMLATPRTELTGDLPRGIEYVAIAPIGIGLAHLIVLLFGNRGNSGSKQG
jgi:hypothetical protein